MKHFSALVFVGAVLLAGCAAQQPQGSGPGEGLSKRLMQRGDMLDVKVVKSMAQRKGDILVVQTELHNDSGYDRNVYWRYRWFDKDGMLVGEEGTWNPLLVYGQQTQWIRGTAPSAKASDFKIELSAEDTRGPK
jgi:uncharacterized protein YcfL